MKQLFFILIIFCAFSVNAQVKAPKGFDVGGTIIDANEVKSLNGITGNIKDTLDSKISTSTLGSSLDEFYNKTQSNTRFINEDGDTITGTILVPTPAPGDNSQQTANTAFVLNESISNGLKAAKILEFPGIQFPAFCFNSPNGTEALVDRRVRSIAVYVNRSITVSTIYYRLATSGVYTAENFNGFTVSSYSNGILTKIAETANSSSAWASPAGVFNSLPLISPITLSPGLYYISAYVNWSGTPTTTPVFTTIGNAEVGLVGTSRYISFRTESIDAIQTTISMTSSSYQALVPAFWF